MKVEKDTIEKSKTVIITVFLASLLVSVGILGGTLLCEMEKEEITTYPEFELTEYQVNDFFWTISPGDNVSIYYKVEDNYLLGCIHLENNNKTAPFEPSTIDYCKRIKEIK